MRRLTAGLLAVCLLAPMSAVAQEPSAEPGPVGPSLLSRPTDEPLSFMYVEFPAGWRLINDRPGWGHFVKNLWADEWCEAGSLADPDLTAEAYAAEFVSFFADSTEVVDISRTVIDLPAGQAQRLDLKRTDDDEDQTHYLVSDGERLYLLNCSGATRPVDGWLPIAESLIIGDIRTGLPDGWEEAIPFDPRVAMPMFGFAVEFPMEWDVYPFIKQTDPSTGDILQANATGASCRISDYTAVAETERWATVANKAADQPAIEVLDLPAGKVGRETHQTEDGSVSTIYWFADGRHWFRMSCGPMEGAPPDDRWLSIAESFEFLPEEE